MNKKYTYKPLLLGVLFLSLVIISCTKKKDDTPIPEVVAKPLATIGFVEYASGNNRRIFIGITQVGDIATNYYGVFDTGSTGMTLDADGLIPASMITTSGITITGDSVNVNGITIKNKPAIMAYGDNISSTKEYGYLAYTKVTIGDPVGGKLTTKRIPFFLYYKIVDNTGFQYPAHAADVFGVGPGVSYASNLIASPLSYFDLPAGGINGFKMASVGGTGYTSAGTYAPGLLTIGLIPSDLTSAGFIMHPLSFSTSGGYSANIPSTITYNGKTISGQILFDTGTPSHTVIEDLTAAVGTLPVNSTISIVTNKGFKYSYITTSSNNLTEVQNPNNTGDTRTIFALDFFFTNQYLTDYANHQIGLKNN